MPPVLQGGIKMQSSVVAACCECTSNAVESRAPFTQILIIFRYTQIIDRCLTDAQLISKGDPNEDGDKL